MAARYVFIAPNVWLHQRQRVVRHPIGKDENEMHGQNAQSRGEYHRVDVDHDPWLLLPVRAPRRLN